MPRPLEYNEAMGSPEAHLAVMKNRVDGAQADYGRAVQKGHSAQIASAKEHLDQSRREYEDFMTGSSGQSKDSEAKAATAVH